MQIKGSYRHINIGLFLLIFCITAYPVYPSVAWGAEKAQTVAKAAAIGAGTAEGKVSSDTVGTGAAVGNAGKGAAKELSPLKIGGIAAAAAVVVGLGAAAFSGGGGGSSSSTSNHP